MLGGFAGLIGASVVGPRFRKRPEDLVIQREGKGINEVKHIKYIFDKYPMITDELTNWIRFSDEEYYCHNNLYIAVGTFILWVCWNFFNGGALLSVFEPRKRSIPKVIMNTTLSAAISGLVAVSIKPHVMKTYSIHNKFDVSTICNGILIGLVSITGVCDAVSPVYALVIGGFGGLFYCLFCRFLDKFMIDDPVEASAVHLMGGIWGTLATGIFDQDKGLISKNLNKGEFFSY